MPPQFLFVSLGFIPLLLSRTLYHLLILLTLVGMNVNVNVNVNMDMYPQPRLHITTGLGGLKWQCHFDRQAVPVDMAGPSEART